MSPISGNTGKEVKIMEEAHMKKFSAMLALLVLFLAFTTGVSAEETVYCFSESDFEENLRGIILTDVPQNGKLHLGDRVLKPGDVVTMDQAKTMTFAGEEEGPESLSYLPVGGDGLREKVSMLIPGLKNQPPVAEDRAFETYKNLPNSGFLPVKDPEQKEVTVTILKEPRRGTVTLEPDGKFTYTPKKNKVGTDSFRYQASDPEGNLSREATVTITILKPSDSPQYQDTMGLSCRYAAEWMKNTGIFQAESLGETCCFSPQKPVSRGEFLTMLLKTLEIPEEENLTLGLEQVPYWLRPYMAAAVRHGLTAGLPTWNDYLEPVTGAEAAVLAENALDLPVFAAFSGEEPEAKGIAAGEEILTREEAAELLLEVHRIKKGI